MQTRNILFFLIVLFITISACDNNTDQQQSQAAENEEDDQASSNLYTIKIDGNPLKVEIAQTDESRMQGLMFREKLQENQGMLFAFSSQRVLSFWMRNTYIPLEIAFINEDDLRGGFQNLS